MSTGVSSQPAEFGKWRTALWPIHNYEMKKIFAFRLNYVSHIVQLYDFTRYKRCSHCNRSRWRCSRSQLFKRVGAFMPAAILFVVMYTKLSNIMSQSKIFYWVVSTFIAFFGAFAFFLYPNQDFTSSKH